MYFPYHKIHPFKVVFNIVTDLGNSQHGLILECFTPPLAVPYTFSVTPGPPLPAPVSNHNTLCASLDWPVLGSLYKWNHVALCGLLF